MRREERKRKMNDHDLRRREICQKRASGSSERIKSKHHNATPAARYRVRTEYVQRTRLASSHAMLCTSRAHRRTHTPPSTGYLYTPTGTHGSGS